MEEKSDCMKSKKTFLLHIQIYQSNSILKDNRRNILIDTNLAGWILFQAIDLFIIF